MFFSSDDGLRNVENTHGVTLAPNEFSDQHFSASLFVAVTSTSQRYRTECGFELCAKSFSQNCFAQINTVTVKGLNKRIPSVLKGGVWDRHVGLTSAGIEEGHME